MKKITFLSILTVLYFAAFSQSKLTSINPNRIYTQNASQEKGYGPISLKLEINGEKIFSDNTNNFNFDDHIKLFFKKGDKLEPVKISSWAFLSAGTGKVSTWVISDQWLNNSTPVGVYIETDGVRSNTIYLTVVDIPRLPPVIATLNPYKITTGKGETIFVRGKNLGEDRTTKVLINGIEASLRDYSYINEWIDVYLPQSIRETPGTYPVIVESIFGKSNTLYFTVENPLLRIAPVQKAPTVSPTVQQQNGINKLQQKTVEPLSVVGSGIIIYLSGTIILEANKTYLQEYIQELDEVKRINNNLKIGSNENVSVTIKGVNTAAITLEHVKLSIEKKLKVLGISGIVEFN